MFNRILIQVAALLLLLACGGASASSSSSKRQFMFVEDIRGETGGCDLRCWVDKLVVVVPEIEAQFTAIWIDGTFTLTNLTLSHIAIGNISSEWYPDKNANTSNAVKLDLTGVGVDIWSKFHVKWGLIDVRGEMIAEVSRTSFSLALQLDKSEDGLVDHVGCPHCNLNANIDKAEISTSSGALDAIANTLIDLFKGMITNTIEDLACSELPAMVESNGTALFQMINGYLRPYMNTTYPRNVPVVGTMSDLRTSAIIDCARFIFNSFTGIDGPLNFNRVINLISNNTGIIRLSDFYNETIAFTIPIEDLGAELTIGLISLNITDLNTWDYIDIMIPVSEVKLNGHTGLEQLGINITFFVNVTVNGTMISSTEYLYESADLNIHVSNNEMWGQFQVASYTGVAGNYSNVMCTNLSCIVSLLSAESTALTHLRFNTTIDLIKMLSAGGSLEADVQQTLDLIIELFLDNYVFAIPPLLNGLVGGPGTDMVNDLVYKLISENSGCTHVDDPIVHEVEVAATSASVIAFTAFWAAFAALPVFYCFRRRTLKAEELKRTGSSESAFSANEMSPRIEQDAAVTAPKPSDRTYGCLCGCVGGGKLRWMREFGRTDPEGASLFMDKRVNVFARFLVPLIVLLNIAFFISSNTGIGAQVFVLITLGSGRTVELPSLFDFGLINTIEDMWKGGVYPLAILIGVMSGLWPYVKLVMMFIVWMLPVSIFKEKWRENMLMALDMLGKWSLIDSFVMVLMLVAFHFHVVFPIVNTATIDAPVMIDVFVNAAYGFVSFMLATVLSLVMSHIILAIHRGVKARKDENTGAEATKFKPLVSYCEPKRFVLFSRIGVAVLLVAALGLVVVGVSVASFSFDFLGLAGWALGLLGLDAHREYSVISLGVAVPAAARYPNSFAIRSTQIIYIVTAFLLPILHLVTLIVLWLLPLNRRIQKIIYITCEVMNAWSCLEVFVISIIAAILEIGQFTQFMVGDMCDFINPYIEQFFGGLLDGHNTCFEVQAQLLSGCWLLFIASIIYIAASMIVMRVCRSALNKRMPPLPADAQLEDINMQTRRLDESRGINESSLSRAYSSDSSASVSPAPVVTMTPVALYPMIPPPPSDSEHSTGSDQQQVGGYEEAPAAATIMEEPEVEPARDDDSPPLHSSTTVMFRAAPSSPAPRL